MNYEAESIRRVAAVPGAGPISDRNATTFHCAQMMLPDHHLPNFPLAHLANMQLHAPLHAPLDSLANIFLDPLFLTWMLL